MDGDLKRHEWKQPPKQKSGFTMIELIMVITALGFLAVAALPAYVNLIADAQTANEQGVANGVRAGIATQLVADYVAGNTNPVFPASLGGAANAVCTETNVCFTTVVPGGITENWRRMSSSTYRSPASDSNIWTYTSSNGSFVKTAT
jgi:prepilin-type N-terminal cleavage/methylation domain-containing protein